MEKYSLLRILENNISGQHNFGFLFDIDGVLIRGKNVLQSVPQTFQRLMGPDKKLRIPTVFVTNSGNTTKHEKAADLSRWLGVYIDESQVVLSYSPLCKYSEYYSKKILVSGQGDVKQIVSELGFNNIITMQELVYNFPSLDYIDKNKRDPFNGPKEIDFKKIDGIILLNEPVNWETSLQLIVDLLVTNGMPSHVLPVVPYPHIFVIACNMDLIWVSEAPIPRYGHGSFLLCLENLYKKITGHDLIYTSLIGKPSLLTYRYASEQLLKYAQSINDNCKIDRIYAVGDNVNTDIYGANLYNRYLMELDTFSEADNIHQKLPIREKSNEYSHKNCISVLVETGVHNRNSIVFPNHCHRNFLPVDESLIVPTLTVPDVTCAINFILTKENFE
ncbi:haloacid dehalogenase-like hydrolase domain-containing 5 isoform X2 [Phymastichus coffea]|uniref:haloacid dehalogenase-like hydrolase domain-containing 5 isoform X2 n=1 Tax=Phymastichus coffea TaxID=108790 RepID=UPI00273B266D|nr:haloacid dehalogenase-like hydrolase domain-containing 5 isoform X2 [Phymastichus coffea]